MSEEKKEKEAWLYASISPRLTGHEDLEEFNEKLKELKELGDKLAPEGKMVVALFTKDESFRPMEKLMSNLVLAKRKFSERAIMNNPSIAAKFSELGDKVSGLNRYIDKLKGPRKNTKK